MQHISATIVRYELSPISIKKYLYTHTCIYNGAEIGLTRPFWLGNTMSTTLGKNTAKECKDCQGIDVKYKYSPKSMR